MTRWKKIEGFPNYAVSSSGEVYSRVTSKLLKLNTALPYARVTLGRGNTRYVHKLVAEAFVGTKPKGMEVRHLDGNCRNNHYKNLAYGTSGQNTSDSKRHGTFSERERHGCAKLTPEQVDAIRRDREEGWLTYKELSEKYKIGKSQAHRICTRKSWKCG